MIFNPSRAELESAFRSQAAFAAGYSPLYSQLFATVAGWLAGDAADPVVDWLLDAAAGRGAIEVTLLLAAGLHREELEREKGGGGEGALFHPPSPFPPFSLSLRETILTHRERLTDFIRRENVQTNETGRGLAWLLPVACLGWPAVHLVELGASAGLNLVAERRVYRLAAAGDPERTLLQLGDGPPQFTTLAHGAAEIPPVVCCPAVLSRNGGDMHPFPLRSAADETRLASFIWADQADRLRRLREGIAALRGVETTAAPVRLHPLHLPDGLPAFLDAVVPSSPASPVVIYNTVVTMYLPDRGASLRGHIAAWAEAQRVPVLWLQWEGAWDGPPPPEREWQAWTADYWPNDGRAAPHHWQLAWVHPHGTDLQWREDWPAFLSIAMQN